MFGPDWQCSERKFGVKKLKDVAIPMDDGVRLAGDIFLPEGVTGKVPVILGISYYCKDFMTDSPIKTGAHGFPKGWIESGKPDFYVRRGYAMANVNVRGTGKSEGFTQYGGPREVLDTREIIRWLAQQDWCDGNVGMFGVSSYAITQQAVAVLDPDELKCIFAPFAWTDWYRDMAYHGGILARQWHLGWPFVLDNPRAQSFTQAKLGEAEYKKKIQEALADEEIFLQAGLVEVLENPEHGINPILTDIILNYLDTDFWKERTNQFPKTDIPAFLGSCWYNHCFHLPGAFRAWINWNGPKKMVIGPPIYLDRPVYQYQFESLRWFDYWLKGIDTKIMEEPPIRLWIPEGRDEETRPLGEWRTAEQWPLPETKWTPFYLHERGLLGEHEFFPGEGYDSYGDSPFDHEELWFKSAPLVEQTEICGHIMLDLYASSTQPEEFFFVTLFDIDPDGNADEITRGWLRASQRKVDPAKSTPWEAYLPHDERQPLKPGEIYEFKINLVANARKFLGGHRIALRIRGTDVDEEPVNTLQGLALGHLENPLVSRVTVYHNEDYPSHILLPVTKGNIIGTYVGTGGVLPKPPGGSFPFRKFWMPKELPAAED